MADVTVLGAGGATVTVSLTSQQNADAAQIAANFISKQVTNGILDQVTYSGSGTLPAPGNILGGLIVTGAGANDVGAQVAQYISSVVNSTGKTTIVGTQNNKSTVIAGDGGLTYLNLSKQAQIFIGGGNNGVFNATEGATAVVGLDGNSAFGVAGLVSGTSTTINAFDKSLALINEPGNNKFLVNVQAGAKVVVGVQGAGTVPVTVQGGTGTAIQYLAIGGSGFINPGAGNATVFGNVGTGTVSVFGGTQTIGGDKVNLGADFTGKLTVVQGRGYFFGGSAGGNILTTDTIAGAATLQGGGTGDLLISRSAGNTLLAGAGSETLSGFSVAASVGGSNFFAGAGNATIFGNSGGGNLFGLGGGLSVVDGRNEDRIALDKGTGVGNQFFVSTATGGGHAVADFISGTDTFLMTFTNAVSGQSLDTLKFFKAGDAGSPFGAIAGTRLTLTGGTIVDFFSTEVKNTDLV